jgi:hypothetical protein
LALLQGLFALGRVAGDFWDYLYHKNIPVDIALRKFYLSGGRAPATEIIQQLVVSQFEDLNGLTRFACAPCPVLCLAESRSAYGEPSGRAST